MSVIHRKKILNLMSKPVEDPYSLKLTPLLESNQIKDDAVDIRLGSHFLIPRWEESGSFIPGGEKPAQDIAYRLHLPPGRKIVLPGKGVVLASAFEYLKMPGNLTAQVLTRSSIGRIFVTTATATLVHPFYRGCLTLEIVNLGNAPVELDILSRIAQLQFNEIRPIDFLSKDKITGRYAAATEPEFPKFDEDIEEYNKLRSILPKK